MVAGLYHGFAVGDDRIAAAHERAYDYVRLETQRFQRDADAGRALRHLELQRLDLAVGKTVERLHAAAD